MELPDQRLKHILRSKLSAVVKRWPSSRARDWSERFICAVPDYPSIQSILVIGSAIRDVAPRQSDIDFIVLFEGTKPSSIKPPIDVDLRFFDVRRVEKLIAAGHDLLGWAIRFGITIYDPNGLWSETVSEWADKAPFPSASVALERAVKAQGLGRTLLKVGDEDAAREQELTMLTHIARAQLLQRGVYPISRPELPAQLRQIGEGTLANRLERAIAQDEPIDFDVFMSVGEIGR